MAAPLPSTHRPIAALEAMFAANRAAGRKAVAPFVTAGDPDPATSVAVLEALDRAGASLCELGVPYSDPIADGPRGDRPRGDADPGDGQLLARLPPWDRPVRG